MRFTIHAVVLCALVSLTGISVSYSQEMKPLYAVVDYVHADDASVLVAIERNWMPLHQHMVNEGSLIYWGLFSIAYPKGSMQAYNYATIRIYDDFSMIEDAVLDEKYRSVYEESQRNNWDRFLSATNAARTLIKSEVFEVVSSTGHMYEAMGRYIEMDYMDTPEGKEAAYVSAENTYWKPMQEQRIERGLMTGWDLWGLKYPSGTGGAYDFATVNFFDSYEKLALPDYPPEVISGAHPSFGGGDFDRIVDETLETRQMVEMQLWVRINQTTR